MSQDQTTTSALKSHVSAWLTDDGDLLVRRYGNTYTATYKVDGHWLPEVALVPEQWDFSS